MSTDAGSALLLPPPLMLCMLGLALRTGVTLVDVLLLALPPPSLLLFRPRFDAPMCFMAPPLLVSGTDSGV
jgi:hypothetical protein